MNGSSITPASTGTVVLLVEMCVSFSSSSGCRRSCQSTSAARTKDDSTLIEKHTAVSMLPQAASCFSPIHSTGLEHWGEQHRQDRESPRWRCASQWFHSQKLGRKSLYTRAGHSKSSFTPCSFPSIPLMPPQITTRPPQKVSPTVVQLVPTTSATALLLALLYTGMLVSPQSGAV